MIELHFLYAVNFQLSDRPVGIDARARLYVKPGDAGWIALMACRATSGPGDCLEIEIGGIGTLGIGLVAQWSGAVCHSR